MKLTDDELRKLRNAFNVQKKTQANRKPDRNGNAIRLTMFFEEWLNVWIDSGKIALRGSGRGKFCMSRKNDLGDYAIGNVEIKSCEENSREAKQGRMVSQCTRNKMSASRAGCAKDKEHKAKLSETHRSLPQVKCPHCGTKGRKGGAMTRHHFDRCKSVAPHPA
ncbi:hypothetical protein [Polaromonas sp.]|uniref:hypothetical protein n=1 Tax=Polaromonas sp. TaxID=1869339 RepID=UPI0013B66BAE|nr:hypothetical protein [Polaromonas sp.]NDP63517.1 hypothetical protein [Polaromonas sp.]